MLHAKECSFYSQQMITHRVCRPGDCWLRSQCQLHSHCSPAGGRCPTSVPQPGAAAEPAAGAWLQAPPPGELTAQRSKGTARATSWCCNAIVNSVGWATCSIVVLAWTTAGQASAAPSAASLAMLSPTSTVTQALQPSGRPSCRPASPVAPPRWVLVPAEQLLSACSQCVLQLAGLHSAT